ncbi:MAG: type IX secretion system protein PorQ [Bacteroidia bacterium]|nr:type IX secretion system protein PorQ [Bacteroidia bacterium]
MWVYSLLLYGALFAQIAGRWSYDFLAIAPTARTAALGGLAFPGEAELGAAFQNPALLRSSYHHTFQLSVQPYLADMFVSTLAYGHEWQEVGSFWAGLQYVNYGTLRHTDEVGNILGTFQAYEGAIAAGAARHFGRWHAGMNLKIPFSVVTLDQYRRLGLATDIGVVYEDTAKGLSASLLLRNLGTELYRPTGRPFAQPFPTMLQTTLSYQVPHAPFRLHIGLIHLERWKMAYNDPLQPIRYDIAGNIIPPPPPKWTEHLFRHLVAGVDMLPGKLIQFRFAYHVQRRRELNPVGSQALGGLSFGAGLRARKWAVDYGYALFFRQAATHTLSLTLKPFRERPLP